MKEGWTNCKIGDICSITDFVSNGSFASLRENVKYYNSPNYAVLVRLADASNGFDKSRFVYTDEHGYNFSKKSHLHGGELIMSNVGSVGSMFICPVMKQPMTLAPNTISITSQNNRFLYYYFLSDGFKVKLNGITSSTTLKKFNKTNFKLLEITIPSLSEQQSIVDYLDSAFAKIDTLKANAEKALNEAKALFQASLKEMLEPKEGWEEKKLGDIAEDSADGPFGSNLKKEHYTTQKEVRIIQLSNIGEDGWREENTKYTTFEHLKNISRSEVEPNDIVIAKMMPAGRAILCPSHEPKFVLSSDAVKIKLKKGMETRFILHSINSPYFRNEVYENVTGSGRVRTSLTKLRVCSIFLPPLSVQQSIVATLDSLKSKVDRLQENYEKISQECDALKQAILRQVFE